ncbi:MAG: InlB B-repeat-containing protein [Clostridia bacterium]|nr:InlB B-repeat-containing protein [Clostridia bacterium]
MKILNKLSLFLIVICLAVSVTACKKNNSNENNNQNPPAIKYTVTFVLDDETYETKQVNAGEKVEEPTTPNKTNYEFIGWFSNELKWDFSKNTVNGNITLKAKFEIITYNITFMVGDETYKTLQVNSGEKFEKPTDPSKKHSLFGGWFDGETKWDFETHTASKDVTLTAKFLSDFDEDGYKIIFTKEQFKDYGLNPVNYKVNARLYDNIDLAEIEWTPIGNDRNPYAAIFDGNGFTISNFKITTVYVDEYYNSGYVGLFGLIEQSEIKNLSVENFEIEVKRDVLGNEDISCGGLVGFAALSEISNCSVKGDLNITGNQISIGGLIGWAYRDVTIINSFAKSNINTKSYGVNGSSAGGLIGLAYDLITISNCYATGNVTAIASGYRAYAGGLVGEIGKLNEPNQIGGAYISGIISSCYATGNISSSSAEDNAYSGGLVGEAINCEITNVYATGNSISAGAVFSYAGGLIASANSTKISYAYATGNSETSSFIKAYAGGLVGIFTNYGNLNKISITNAYAMGNAKSIVTTKDANKAISGGFVAYSLDVDEFVSCYKFYEQELSATVNKNGTEQNGSINNLGTSNDLQGILAFVSEYFFADKWSISTQSHPTLIF